MDEPMITIEVRPFPDETYTYEAIAVEGQPGVFQRGKLLRVTRIGAVTGHGSVGIEVGDGNDLDMDVWGANE